MNWLSNVNVNLSASTVMSPRVSVCEGCLEPIINENILEPKPGHLYHVRCFKTSKNHYQDYIKNRDKLQVYVKPEPFIDSNIYKTIESRFGPPNFKNHPLNIKINHNNGPTNTIEIEVLNQECQITNLQLKIANPKNYKLSDLFSGFATRSSYKKSQEFVNDIESHFSVLSNFIDCNVSYETGYININGLFHNKILHYSTSYRKFYISLKKVNSKEFYNNINFILNADIYQNNNNIDTTVEYEEDDDVDIARYKFLNPQVFSHPIIGNKIRTSLDINCLYLTKLPASLDLMSRVRLEMDGIEVFNMEPKKLIKANKANGINYPGILIVFNPLVLDNIENLINTSLIKNFNIYIDWIDPNIKSNSIIANVLVTNIYQLRKSSSSESKYQSDFTFAL